jgi:SOS-response transcriptional repressor LexA
MARPFPATSRQLRLLRFIRGYLLAKGYSPCLDEMREAMGSVGKSKSGIACMLDGLEERGHIRRLRQRARAVEVLTEIPLPAAPDGAPLFAVPGPWEARD